MASDPHASPQIEVVSLKQKINFMVQQGERWKRVFKLFTDKRGDLFLSFPYFRAESYHVGIGTLPAGASTRTLNFVAEGRVSRIPLKLSYHSDGQFHFKPISPRVESLPVHYKNAEAKTTPFDLLRAQHILTIEARGLERFEDCAPTKPSELYRTFSVPLDARRFEFVFYAGLSDADLSGRFKACKFFQIQRPLPNPPMTIGVYLRMTPAVSGETTDALFMCLGGFVFDSEGATSFPFLIGK